MNDTATQRSRARNFGLIPWNKGKTLSSRHRLNISLGLTGKHRGPPSEETKNKIAAAKLGVKRGPMSAEQKEKIKLALTGRPSPLKGRQLSEERREAMRGRPGTWTGKHHSKESLKKMSDSHKGSKNPRWNGGDGEYPPTFTKALRKAIKERDCYTCKICGKHGKNVCLHVHHIDEDKSNSTVENLVTLCVPCHTKITKNAKKRTA